MKFRNILIYFVISMAEVPEEEIIVDYCSVIHAGSTCFQGVECTDLFWTTPEKTEFTRDFTGHLGGVMPVVSCQEASEIVINPTAWSATYRELDIAGISEGIVRRRDLLREILHAFNRFPFDEDAESVDILAEMYRLVSGTDQNLGDLERKVANLVLLQSLEFNSLWFTLRDIGFTVSLLPVTPTSLRTMDRLAQFAFLISDMETHGLVAPAPLVTLHQALIFFSPNYRSSEPSDIFSFLRPVAALTEDHGARAAGYASQIDRTVDEALRYKHLKLTGQQLVLQDVGILIFGEIVRILAGSSVADATEPTKIIEYLFKTRVCPNLEAVADYLAGLAIVRAGVFEILSPYIGSLVFICRDETTAITRIATSVLFRGPPQTQAAHLGYQYHLYLPRETSMTVSTNFLMDTRPMYFLDLVVVAQDAENMGYIGQRKQWIGQMIEAFIKVDDANPSVWSYTDDSKRFITLNRLLKLEGENRAKVRAAGRVIGFALRYDIPIRKSFAPSFMRSLRIFSNPEVTEAEMDGLIAVEDPTFIAGLSWLSGVDWVNPPPTVKWMNFDGLKPNGDMMDLKQTNWQEYIRGRKLEKLFYGSSRIMSVFRAGVADVVGAGVFDMLTEEELAARFLPIPTGFTSELLLGGIDFPRLTHIEHRDLLMTVLSQLDESERRLFNYFVTGVSEPPITAATEKWIKAFFIPVLDVNSLPVTHTCHNEIQIPLYGSLDIMRAKIRLAFSESNSIEGYPGYGQPQPQQTIQDQPNNNP